MGDERIMADLIEHELPIERIAIEELTYKHGLVDKLGQPFIDVFVEFGSTSRDGYFVQGLNLRVRNDDDPPALYFFGKIYALLKLEVDEDGMASLTTQHATTIANILFDTLRGVVIATAPRRDLRYGGLPFVKIDAIIADAAHGDELIRIPKQQDPQ
jgi:hypothetical protein